MSCAAVPILQNSKCTEQFSKNSIHTNRSFGVFETRGAHVTTLCVAVSATVGLLICVGVLAGKRLRRCGTYQPANSPPERSEVKQVGRHSNVQNTPVAAATGVEMHRPQAIVHYTSKADDSVVPEIQVIQPFAQSTEPVLAGRAPLDSQRRQSI